MGVPPWGKMTIFHGLPSYYGSVEHEAESTVCSNKGTEVKTDIGQTQKQGENMAMTSATIFSKPYPGNIVFAVLR